MWASSDHAGARRLPHWFVPVAILITGEPDRAGTDGDNLATTPG